MTIRQPVINTMKRVGISYQSLADRTDKVTVYNRFGFGSCETTPLMAHLIAWVYFVSDCYEQGNSKVTLDDFDRIKYFVAEQDSNAYMTCLD
jgi:hypothetical protein